MVRTLFFFLTFLPWTLFVIVTGVPLSWIKADYLHSYAAIWARVGLVLAGVRLRISGREHLPAQGPVIFMPNHQGNFDILALHAGLPVQFRWLAKEELFRIPFLGFAMRCCGYISIDRSDRRKALQSMAEAARRIAAGTSVVIFPEGTRSPDGTLLPFKKGGFVLAVQSGVPIVPVAIAGSAAIMPKHSRWIHGGNLSVEILPPLATAELVDSGRDALMEEVRRAIDASLQRRAEGKA